MSGKLTILEILSRVNPSFSKPGNWRPLIIQCDRKLLAQELSRKEVPQLIGFAFAAIGEGHSEEAINWISLVMYCYPDRGIDEIRRRGIFRCSKYAFHAGHLRTVLSSLIDRSADFELSEDFIRYLKSASNLLHLAASARNIDRSLREFSIRRRDRVLKTIVALVDSLFLLEHGQDLSLSSDDWRYYAKEDLAEAGSYIIHCLDEETGIRDENFNFIDENSLLSGLYNNLLVRACKIRCYLEAEILIDAFDYRCSRRGREVTVTAPFPELEKSIRLGYIQSQQADQIKSIDRIRSVKEGNLSIFDAADLFYDRYRDQLIAVVDWPARRCVFYFPNAPEFQSFFAHDGLLVEEDIDLKGILQAELATWAELKSFEIRKGVSVFDLLKAHRLFKFLGLIAKKHLKPLLEQDPALAYRSLIPVFEIEDLRSLVGWCMSKDTINTVVDMMSWKPGAGEFVDLQYKPIIKSARYYLVPMSIAGTVNWYRNLAHTQKHRVIDGAEEEAASRALSSVLSRTSGLVRKGFETTFGEETIEIDVIYRLGSCLFLFECKHALLPCNPHELRTTYEHIKKGAQTLSRIVRLLKEDDGEAELYRRLGWNVPLAAEIVTCIVSCNGMFPGLSILGHPVRRWPELWNMIESGVVKVGSVRIVEKDKELVVQDERIERKLWSGPELTSEFLKEYIEGQWSTEIYFSAMVPWKRRYRLGESDLVFSTFGVDPDLVQKQVEALP